MGRTSIGACLSVAALLIIAGTAMGQTQQAAPPARPTTDAGLGKGVTVRSVDDRASMNLRARVQVRFTGVAESDLEREDTTEIAVRRMRLVFQGNAAGPRLTYYVQLAFSNLDNEADLRLPLRDAYVTWTPARDLNVRLGQMKVPFSRQRVISSSALQMVDRSIVVSELNLDRDVGLQLFSRNLLGVGRLGYSVGVFGGEGRNRVGRAAGILYTARVETWPLGSFDDTSEADLQRTDAWRIAIGANVGYNQNTNRPRSTFGAPYLAGDFDYTHAGVDATVRKKGWSVSSELLYRHADRDALTTSVNHAPLVIRSRSGWGAFVQAGTLLTEHVELTARHSYLKPADGADPSFVELQESGAGLSYYLNRNDLKIQGDYFQITDAATHLRTHQVRTQFQLFF